MSYLTAVAIFELGLFGTIAYFATRGNTYGLQKTILNLLIIFFALALAMHLLPGFNNPVLIANIKFSADAAPFIQYANFDKASVGLILLAFFCRRVKDSTEGWQILRRISLPTLITITGVIASGVMMKYVKPDIKLPAPTLIFLMTNLLFTCVVEEAFFQGFLQERFANALKSLRLGGFIAILLSGALFGIAHVAGGSRYVILATFSGMGYAYIYALVRRIEAPIFAHFALNAIHFVSFTYPYIQSS